MDFIKNLHEARMLRDQQNAVKYTYSDCAERAYIMLMVVDLLSQYPEYKLKIKEYSRKTHQSSYNSFRMGSTDLHNFLYFLSGSDSFKKLKNPEAAAEMKAASSVPIEKINNFLSSLMNSEKPQLTTSMFIDMETGLKLTNNTYKDIRRKLSNWADITKSEQKVAATSLIYAVRAKLRSSDIIEMFEEWASKFDVEINRVPDNEPVISTPDIVTTGPDLALYRYLVGTENVALLRQMLDMAKNNKPIPQRHMQAYMPIVQIVDDIVKGGPAFMQRLKVLQTRANRSRKR